MPVWSNIVHRFRRSRKSETGQAVESVMKQQQGKFILFDVPDFASWLDGSSFSRVIHVLQCHHTFIPSYQNFHQTNHFDLLEAMERAHLERGFSEIAQNLTTFPDGLVAVCRSIDITCSAELLCSLLIWQINCSAHLVRSAPCRKGLCNLSSWLHHQRRCWCADQLSVSSPAD
jgi:hypothetical protein